MQTGHYQSNGQLWEHGDQPTCYYCGTLATHETHTSGVNICNKQKCAVEHREAQFNEIKLFDDGKAKCSFCEEVVEYNEDQWDSKVCPKCIKGMEASIYMDNN